MSHSDYLALLRAHAEALAIRWEVTGQRPGRRVVADVLGITADASRRRVMPTLVGLTSPAELRTWAGVAQAPQPEVRTQGSGAAEAVGVEHSYNEDTREHRFWLPRRVTPVVITEDELQEMARDYANNTAARVAAAHGLSRREFMLIKSYLGWTKDSVCLTPAQISDALADPAAEAALESERTAALMSRLDRRSREAVWRETEVLASWARGVKRGAVDPMAHAIEQIVATYEPPRPPAVAPPAYWPALLILSPTDLHYGLGTWTGYGSGAYDRAICRERLLSSMKEIVNRLPVRPEEILFVVGGDWVHIDTPSGTTTKGTPQDLDGVPEEIADGAIALAIDAVEVCRVYADRVTVAVVPGNHDRWTLTTAVRSTLAAWYRSETDVRVIGGLGAYGYHRWRSTLIGMSHGDRMHRAADLSTRMATERARDWAECQTRLWVTGHRHVAALEEDAGVIVMQCPSLAEASRWEEERYHGRTPSLMGALVDESGCMTWTWARVGGAA